MQGVHETVAFLVARRLAGVGTKVILDVQGDWHEATRLYGSPLRRLLNPVNDALAPLAVRGADAVRTVSTQTTGLVRALGVEPAAVFPSYVDAEAFLERPPAPLPDAAARRLRRRARALQGVRHARRGVAASPRRAFPDATLHLVGDGTMRDRAERSSPSCPSRPSGRARLDAPRRSRPRWTTSWLVCLPSRSEGLPRVALEAACRGRAIVGGNRAGIPDVVAATT